MNFIRFALALVVLVAGCRHEIRPAYQEPSPLADCTTVLVSDVLQSSGIVRVLQRDGLGSRRWREVGPLTDDPDYAAAMARISWTGGVMDKSTLAWWTNHDGEAPARFASERPYVDGVRNVWWAHCLHGVYRPWASHNADGWHVWVTLTLPDAQEPPDLSDWTMFGAPWRRGMYDRATRKVYSEWCVDVEITEMSDADLLAITDQIGRASHELQAGTPDWPGGLQYYIGTYPYYRDGGRTEDLWRYPIGE